MNGWARAFGEATIGLAIAACYGMIVHDNWHRVADERAALGLFFGVPIALMLAWLGIDEARRRRR